RGLFGSPRPADAAQEKELAFCEIMRNMEKILLAVLLALPGFAHASPIGPEAPHPVGEKLPLPDAVAPSLIPAASAPPAFAAGFSAEAPLERRVAVALQLYQGIRREVGTVVAGQDEAVEQLLTAVIAGG